MPVLFRQRQPQFGGDGQQDLVLREHGVGQIDRFNVVREPFEQHAAEHGLAASDLAADLDDALIVGDRIDQCFERGAAVGTGKEELGVRRDAERRLLQSEMIEIHHGSRAVASMRL
jgi:hypothetical protein